MKIQNHPSFDEEKKFWKRNKLVIGIDEVGRGAFAGPIVAAAVVFPPNFSIDHGSILEGINDSKQVKPLARIKLDKLIRKNILYFAVDSVRVSVINKVGIGQANRMVFRKVVAQVIQQAKLKNPNSNFHLLVDGFHVKFVRQAGLKHQKAIVKGDQKCFSIAAASIIAKVHRDRLMKRYHRQFPQFGFGRNKGYGTLDHRKALRDFGLTKIHRVAFSNNVQV